MRHRGSGSRSRRYVESSMAGMAYACALVVLGVLVMASFRPAGLPAPYWGPLDWLRTDTMGAVCFVVAVLAFCASEYLRLRRGAERRSTADVSSEDPAALRTVFSMAVARTLAIAGTGVVLYLSVNTVTHPWSSDLPATHLVPWPTESTLRVLALIIVAGAASVARAQRIDAFGGNRVR